MESQDYLFMKKPKLINLNKKKVSSPFNSPNFEIKPENKLSEISKEKEDEEIMKKIDKENYFRNPFKFMDYLAKKYFIENANTLENLKIKQEMTTNFQKICNQIKNDISNYTRNEEMYLRGLRQEIKAKLNGDPLLLNLNVKDSLNNNQEKGKLGDIGDSKNLQSSPMTMEDKEFLMRVIGNQGFDGGSPMDGITTTANALNYVNSNKNSKISDNNFYLNALSCLKGDKLITPKSQFLVVKELSLNDIDQKKIKDTQNIIDLKNKMKIEQYNNEIMGKNKDKNYKKIKNKIDISKNNEKKSLEDLISYSDNHINNLKQYQKETNDLINNLKQKLNIEYEKRAMKFALDKLEINEKVLSQMKNDFNNKNNKNNNQIPPEGQLINWKEKKELLEKEYNDTQTMVNNFLKGRGASLDKTAKKRKTNKKKVKRSSSSFPYNSYYKKNYYNYKYY